MTAICGSKNFAIKCRKCRSTKIQIVVDEWDSILGYGVRIKIECTVCGAEETTYEHRGDRK